MSNLFERIEEDLVSSEDDIRVLRNYLNATALSRGWTLDEFCSWLEDNYGEEQ